MRKMFVCIAISDLLFSSFLLGVKHLLSVQPMCSTNVQVLIGKALHSAGLSVNDVGYIALHGTGTPLGDPIEVGAIAGAFSQRASASDCIALGSVKV